MFLASCIKLDEDALICDFAETYNIYNYRELPLDLVATLCFGLRDNSRIKLKMGGTMFDTNTMLIASALDGINTLCWMQTEDAKKGRNRPPSIVKALTDQNKPKEYISFRSIDDFERMRHTIMETN